MTNVHHSADAAPARLIQSFKPGYKAVCDCRASGGRIEPGECGGLRVFNPHGFPVAVFRGRWYRAVQTHDRNLTVYSLAVEH